MENRKKKSSKLSPAKVATEAAEFIQTLLDDTQPISEIASDFQRRHASTSRVSILRAMAQELRGPSNKPTTDRLLEFLLLSTEPGHPNTINPALGASVEVALTLGPEIGQAMGANILRQRLFLGIAGRITLPLPECDRSVGGFFRTQPGSSAVLVRLLAQSPGERAPTPDFMAGWCILLRFWLTGRYPAGTEHSLRAASLLRELCRLDLSILSDDLKLLFPRLVALAGTEALQELRESVVIRNLVSQRFLLLPSYPVPTSPGPQPVQAPALQAPQPTPSQVPLPDPFEGLDEQASSLVNSLLVYLRGIGKKDADLLQRLRQQDERQQSLRREAASLSRELKLATQETEDTRTRLEDELRGARTQFTTKAAECETLKKTVDDWKRELQRSEHGLQSEQGRLQEELTKQVRAQLLAPAEDVREHIVQQLKVTDPESSWHRLAISFDRLYRRIVRVAGSQYVEWLPRREEQPRT